ncbi:MAG: hypothetical protein FJ218_11520, partial [Ignavibacteria bacterium]|nr:hypothetical protein [Ignavibacteria bacterium]
YNDLGSVGQPSQLTYRGMSTRNIGIFIDGRPMNEPLTGIADINFIPTEMIERVEIIPAPRSLLYGMNSNAVAINIVTKSYNSKIPYSRIKYTEGAYEEGLFDGVLAHNLSRNLNLSVGVQRRTTDGRYENSANDEWNARSKLRWNVSKKFNVELLQMYNKQKVGLFGGVDYFKSQDIYDPNFSIVADQYQKYYNSQWCWQVNGVASFFHDTLARSFFSFYTSNLRFEYSDTAFDPKYHSVWNGILLSQKFNVQDFFFTFRANIEKRSAERNNTSRNFWVSKMYSSLSCKVETDITTQTQFSFFGKFERDTVLFSDYFSYRRNNFGGSFFWGKQNSLSGMIGFVANDVKNNRLFLNVSSQATKTLRIEAQSIFGLNEKIDFLFYVNYTPGKFRLRTTFDIGTDEYGQSTTIPDFEDVEIGLYSFQHVDAQWINIDALYEDKLLENHLNIQTGFRGKFIHRNDDSLRYNSFIDNIERVRLKGFTGTLDFLFFAKLGDAVVHFTIENIFNTKYYVVPFYPMPDRNLRLG